MDRLIGLTALVGFTLSLAVHISALLGIDVTARLPFIWLLYLGAFMVFAPFVISVRKYLAAPPKFSELPSLLPGRVVVAACVVFAYAFINFVLFAAATEGGSPSIRDGKYILQSHGRFMRELTEKEYLSFKANEVRGISGHCLAFYFAPFCYFMFRRNRREV